eukprot:1901105-Prymnesium_polylepis.2
MRIASIRAPRAGLAPGGAHGRAFSATPAPTQSPTPCPWPCRMALARTHGGGGQRLGHRIDATMSVGPGCPGMPRCVVPYAGCVAEGVPSPDQMLSACIDIVNAIGEGSQVSSNDALATRSATQLILLLTT